MKMKVRSSPLTLNTGNFKDEEMHLNSLLQEAKSKFEASSKGVSF